MHTFFSHLVTKENDRSLAAMLFLLEICKGEASVQAVRREVLGMGLPYLSEGSMLCDRMRLLTCL